MATAINGCLIVAMMFAWGAHAGEQRVMAAALLVACLSWVVNIAGAANKEFGEWARPIAALAYFITVLTALVSASLIFRAFS